MDRPTCPGKSTSSVLISAKGRRTPRRAAPYPYRYMLDGVGYPSVTEVIQHSGLGLDVAAVPDQEALQRAAERGTRVHEAIGRSLLSESSPDRDLQVEDRGYFDSFRRLRDLLSLVPVEHLGQPLVEYRFHQRDTWPRFAGTVDLVCTAGDSGEVWVVDWKCRSYKSYDGLQTAGYVRGLELCSGLSVGGRRSVHLKKDGSLPKVQIHDDRRDTVVFVAALVVVSHRIGRGWSPAGRT